MPKETTAFQCSYCNYQDNHLVNVERHEKQRHTCKHTRGKIYVDTYDQALTIYCDTCGNIYDSLKLSDLKNDFETLNKVYNFLQPLIK